MYDKEESLAQESFVNHLFSLRVKYGNEVSVDRK